MSNLTIETTIEPSKIRPVALNGTRLTIVFSGVVDEEGDLCLESGHYINNNLLKLAKKITAATPLPQAPGSVIRMDEQLLMQTDTGFWVDGDGMHHYPAVVASNRISIIFDAGKKTDD